MKFTKQEIQEFETVSFYEARTRLLQAAVSFLASDLWFQTATPGPNDDAEMELQEELLNKATLLYAVKLEQLEDRRR